jgi:hypothetical protein
MDDRFALQATNASPVSTSAQMDFDVLDDEDTVTSGTLLSDALKQAEQ